MSNASGCGLLGYSREEAIEDLMVNGGIAHGAAFV
jgi:hypothetical protein